MLSAEQKSCLAVVTVFMCSLPLHASASPITFHLAPSQANIQARSDNEPMSVSESLRNDVANHPGDFITFETAEGANRFIVEHKGADHESDKRVIQRGIVGYWDGKTLVVLPSLLTVAPW
jgi:hypothetical protein